MFFPKILQNVCAKKISDLTILCKPCVIFCGEFFTNTHGVNRHAKSFCNDIAICKQIGEFMRSKFLLAFLLLPIFAQSLERSQVMIDKKGPEKRVKIQVALPSQESKGSFELRAILERQGFNAENGFVGTDNTLYPLEIYNYLYTEGTYTGLYVLNIIMPLDADFFVSFTNPQFLSMKGLAAQKLWEVLRDQMQPVFEGIVERYEWKTSGELNYCYKTISGPTEYSCFIHF